MWVIIALLDPDPDPDSESGSGSTNPIESGSATLTDCVPVGNVLWFAIGRVVDSDEPGPHHFSGSRSEYEAHQDPGSRPFFS